MVNLPQRVSWSFGPGDIKSRSKMYRQGHYAKVRRPTGPELYEDASRILDELLQKQLNEQLRSHGRPPRYKTHPLSDLRPVTAGEVLDERDEAGLEDGIERCKTMPSRMRGSRDEPLLPKDLEALKKKADKHKQESGDGSGSMSSADTEGDSASVTENRKKKGFLRRAKDRLMHSFHRQEREKENKQKDTDSPKMSPKKQAKKTPRKKGAADLNGVKEKGGKHAGTGEGKESVPSPPSEEYGKRRNSTGKTLLNSIRKSFRSKKDDRRTYSFSVQDRAGDDKRPSLASSSGTSRPSPEQEPPPPPPLFSYTQDALHPKPPLPSPPPRSQDSLHPPQGSSLTVPSVDRKGSAHSAHEKSVSPYPYSTSTDSHLDNGDISSSVHSFSSKLSGPHGKNVLDDPGDDIEFMDIVENGDTVQNGEGERTKGVRGQSGGRTGDTQVLAGTRYRNKQQTSLCVDGDSDDKDGKDRLPGSTDDVPLHERTPQEKDQMYGKIAQKLIHIADTFAAESGLSDAEGQHREAAAPPPRIAIEGDGVLSELEKQILECLRDAGDRNTQMIDSQAEGVIQQTKTQTYERFKETVQQSLGNEVSWNHLAFLFYTTKGVMSAVGIGSKLASDAKEMTLRYFSDRFAKWLMDQGGFDSVLSDSDSELD